MTIEFADLDKLPDDVKYQLPDGRELTLGEVREAAKSHVNKRISDLTPREQKLTAKEKEIAEREEAVRRTLATLANTPPPPTVQPPSNEPIPLGYTPEQWAAIRSDPYSRPIVETLAALASRLEDTQRQLKERDDAYTRRDQQLQEQREKEWIDYQFQQMSQGDERYKDPAERQALLEYAKEVLTRRDLTVLDRARNYESRLKSAQEEAYQRGLKEGSSKAPIPSVPYQSRQVTPPPEPVKLPATFNEFVDSAANDNELIRDIREAAASPSPPQ